MTFNAQFNFCYPQPFQAFDHSKNCWNQTIKDHVRLVANRRLSSLSTARLSPWRDGQLSVFFFSVNLIFRLFSTPSFSTPSPFPLRGEQLSGFFFGVNQIFSIFSSPSFSPFRRSPCGADNLAVFVSASTESFDFFDAVISTVCRPPLRAVNLSSSSRSVNRFLKNFQALQSTGWPGNPCRCVGGETYQRTPHGQRYFEFFCFLLWNFFPPEPRISKGLRAFRYNFFSLLRPREILPPQGAALPAQPALPAIRSRVP